nr:antimicrobial peptide NK-lysin [Misgurnus anguillicaudatus]
MTKISCFFLIWALLFFLDIHTGTDCASAHHHSLVKEFSHYDNKATKNKQGRFKCGFCKRVVGKILAIIGKQISKDKTGRQLDNICRKLKIPFCKRFVNKYKNNLINALSAGGHAHTICVKLKLCK